MDPIDVTIKLPDDIRANEVFAVKTRFAHPMHSGRLKDASGKLIPRLIVNRFECRFGDFLVFRCDLEPAMAEDPYIEFTAKLPRSGRMTFIWFEDGGRSVTEQRDVTVA